MGETKTTNSKHKIVVIPAKHKIAVTPVDEYIAKMKACDQHTLT